MLCDKNHKVLIRLLILMVVFAPMQAAVSAIDVFNFSTDQKPHCRMTMSGNMDDEGMDHSRMTHHDVAQDDCCQHEGACLDNCPNCIQCISIFAVLSELSILQHKPVSVFIYPKNSLAYGIIGSAEYRPPRFFS